MIRIGLIGLSSALGCWTSLVQAQTSVVIVVPHASTTDYESFEHRLRSELITEGFQPVSVEVAVEVNAQTLQQNATRLMSPAAISVSLHDQVVSGLVWIRARGPGPDLLREVPDYPIGEQAPTVFAVRAADVLHGALLELGYVGTTPERPLERVPGLPVSPSAGATSQNMPPARRPPASLNPAATAKSANSSNSDTATAPSRPQTPPSVTANGEPPDRRQHEAAEQLWQLRGMAQLGVQSSDQSPSWGLRGSLMRRWNPSFGVGISAGYFFPIEGSAVQGFASVRQAYAGPTLELRQQLSNAFALFESAESGLHGVFVTSKAQYPHVPQSPHLIGGYSSVAVGANWQFIDNLGVVAQAGLLLPWRSAQIVIVDSVVLKAAGPALVLSTGLQLAF